MIINIGRPFGTIEIFTKVLVFMKSQNICVNQFVGEIITYE